MSARASRPVIPWVLVLAAALLLAGPAAATLALTGSTLTPGTLPLVPLTEQMVDARIAVIPSGARTFAAGHSLELETDLLGASWSTTVIVDGYPAARQSSQGTVAFVNGYALSYPTNRDVAMEITLQGTVPRSAGGTITLLSVKELDNGGQVVPGSTVTIMEPIVVPTGTPAPEISPTTSPVPGQTTASPSPTKAGCCLPVPLTVAAGAAGAFFFGNRRKGQS